MGGTNWNYKGFDLSVNWGVELTGDVSLVLPLTVEVSDYDDLAHDEPVIVDLWHWESEAWATADWDSMSREESDKFAENEKEAMERLITKFVDTIARQLIKNGLLS